MAERDDLKPGWRDFSREMADFRLKRENLKPQRVDFRTDGTNIRPEREDLMEGEQMDRH